MYAACYDYQIAFHEGEIHLCHGILLASGLDFRLSSGVLRKMMFRFGGGGCPGLGLGRSRQAFSVLSSFSLYADGIICS